MAIDGLAAVSVDFVRAALGAGDLSDLADAFVVEGVDLAVADLLAPAAFVPDLVSGFLLPAASFDRAAIAAPAPVLASSGLPSDFADDAFDPFAGFAAEVFADVAMFIPSDTIAAKCP
ncbi:hypothetical protein ACSBOB_31325 [Mesorhizobium sp. ASY16-5R]|uniref:hypothetical protein n=1 Tax=Mesorhizobium sp. ASY16-5R TaxID=3445772 RepID=UPI003F9F716E